MKHVVAFSGGKDSTALLLWAKERNLPFMAVFSDTGWEHPLTMAYIQEINRTVLDGRLIILRSDRYSGMEDLVAKKGRVPSAKARFCTDHLKIRPMAIWLATQDEEVTVYHRRVTIQRNAVTRLRPALLKGWRATLDFQVLTPEYIEPHVFHEVLIQAGRLVGVGDFRPTYGRFQVVEIKVLDESR